MATVKEALDQAGPNSLPDMLRRVSLGELMDGMRVRTVARTGLTSSATHVHNAPGTIHAVDLAGTDLTVIGAGATAAAGEVSVAYDADGLATLTFGDGANTAYTCECTVLPAGLGATMASDAQTGT